MYFKVERERNAKGLFLHGIEQMTDKYGFSPKVITFLMFNHFFVAIIILLFSFRFFVKKISVIKY